jgi:hypothetical protein
MGADRNEPSRGRQSEDGDRAGFRRLRGREVSLSQSRTVLGKRRERDAEGGRFGREESRVGEQSVSGRRQDERELAVSMSWPSAAVNVSTGEILWWFRELTGVM